MPYDQSIRTSSRTSNSTQRRDGMKQRSPSVSCVTSCGCGRKPGYVGFDPFADSHNFIEACQERGCPSITIEIDPTTVCAAIE